MALVQIRMDDEEKRKAREVLSSMGLTLSGAVKLYLRKVIQEGRIPFSLEAQSSNTPPKTIPVAASAPSPEQSLHDLVEQHKDDTKVPEQTPARVETPPPTNKNPFSAKRIG